MQSIFIQREKLREKNDDRKVLEKEEEFHSILYNLNFSEQNRTQSKTFFPRSFNLKFIDGKIKSAKS